MPKRLSDDHVRSIVEEAGCQFVGYNPPKVDFVCKCGIESSRLLGEFRRSGQCGRCGHKQGASVRKLSRTQIESVVREAGCDFVDFYYDSGVAKVSYICHCGNRHSQIWGTYLRKKQCPECSTKDRVSSRTLSYDRVCEILGELGFAMLDDTYKNSSTKIRYLCSCGRGGFATLANLSQGQKCKQCQLESLSERFRQSQEEVDDLFSKSGCLLDDVYINNKKKMRFVCSCGKIGEKSLKQFKLHPRCRDCSIKKRSVEYSGENHHGWNPDRVAAEEIKKFRTRCKATLTNALRSLGIKKESTTEQLLGYTHRELKDHIKNHPNWNYIGGRDFHIDHVFPVKAFCEYKVFDISIINCLENLQPLLAQENLTKSDSYCKKEFEAWLTKRGVDFNAPDIA